MDILLSHLCYKLIFQGYCENDANDEDVELDHEDTTDSENSEEEERNDSVTIPDETNRIPQSKRQLFGADDPAIPLATELDPEVEEKQPEG